MYKDYLLRIWTKVLSLGKEKIGNFLGLIIWLASMYIVKYRPVDYCFYEVLLVQIWSRSQDIGILNNLQISVI